MAEDELIQLHLALGIHIRSEFSLLAGNTNLILENGKFADVYRAYAVSQLIIEKTWKALQNKR